MTNIVLCGGAGTRLWPISRTLLPKQFVKLFDDKSLFQLTVERNSSFCEKQLIVSNVDQYFLAVDQLEELKKNDNIMYLLEAIGRNTAPAVALACLSINSEEIVFVTPSDHLIKNEKEYKEVVQKAIELANNNYLVTFGVKPTFAETGYGYIESEGINVKAFHEKPDILTAEKYLKEEKYSWNSGMFMFKARIFLEELEEYSLEIFKASKLAFKNANKSNLIRIKHEDMLTIPEDSIDYAVMEKSNKVKVIPSDIGWSDVGNFDSLSCELSNDKNNNFIISNKHVYTIDLKDLIIIDTNDALLVSKKGSSQKVKNIVNDLKINNKKLTIEHSTVHRPWGTYTVLEDSLGYKIKKIVVKSGARLSLQKHFHRNEHWIVLSGCATITKDSEKFILNPNESTYIKLGHLHRLENEGKEPLVIIEVQVGEYTEEDDIVRIEDDYVRGF